MKEKLLKHIWRILPFAVVIAVLAGFAVWLNRPADGEVDSAVSRLVYEPARVTAVLEDNAYHLKMCQTYGCEYILIEDAYQLPLSLE